MVSKPQRFLLAALFLAALGSPLFAQLSWEKKTLTLAPKAGDEKVEGDFLFTNKSTNTVTIKSVKTSCGCTTANVEKTVYKPGESGTLHVALDLRNRKGTQKKYVLIETDSPQEPITQLTLEADIPAR